MSVQETNKQICRELDLAEPTVKIHVRGILRTLGVSSRTQAVIAVSQILQKQVGAPAWSAH